MLRCLHRLQEYEYGLGLLRTCEYLYSSSFFSAFFLPSESHCGMVLPLDTLYTYDKMISIGKSSQDKNESKVLIGATIL